MPLPKLDKGSKGLDLAITIQPPDWRLKQWQKLRLSALASWDTLWLVI